MRTFISVAVLALALTACGGGDDSSDEKDTPEDTGPSLADAASACEEEVNELLIEETREESGLTFETVMRTGTDGSVTVAPLQTAEFLIKPSVLAGMCMLRESGAPDAVISTVSQATGMSGQQEIDWDGVNLAYSYNANVGFSGVFTEVDAG